MLTDIIIIVVIFAVILFITLQRGKQFVISLIVSTFFAITITKYLLFEPGKIVVSDSLFNIIFILIIIVGIFALRRYLRNYRANGRQGYIGASALSLSATLLILASYFYFLPEVYYSFNPEIRDAFFKNDLTLGIIFCLPIVALLISSKDD